MGMHVIVSCSAVGHAANLPSALTKSPEIIARHRNKSVARSTNAASRHARDPPISQIATLRLSYIDILQLPLFVWTIYWAVIAVT